MQPLRLFLVLLGAIFFLLCVYILSQTSPCDSPTHPSSPPVRVPKFKEEGLFFKFDMDQDDVIELAEVSHIFYYIGISSSLADLRKFIGLFEGQQNSSNGVIEPHEFYSFFSSHNASDPEVSSRTIKKSTLQSLFAQLDDDEDELITLEELRTGYKNLEMPLTIPEMFEFFRIIDTSDDGRLQWDEFKDMFNKPESDQGEWSVLKSMVFIASFWAPRTEEEKKAEEKGMEVKTVILIRHGQSEANAFDDKYDTDSFRWEPSLTAEGRNQCALGSSLLRQYLKESKLSIGLILTSPLYRTIETSTLFFEEEILKDKVPILALPQATETVTGSDDIGDTPSAIRVKWSNHKVGKNISFEELPLEPEVWFWTPPQYDIKTVEDARKNYVATEGEIEEPWRSSVDRSLKLESFIANRKEKVVVVVSHGDYIESYSGVDLRNAKFTVVRLPVEKMKKNNGS